MTIRVNDDVEITVRDGETITIGGMEFVVSLPGERP